MVALLGKQNDRLSSGDNRLTIIVLLIIAIKRDKLFGNRKRGQKFVKVSMISYFCPAAEAGGATG